MMNGFRPVGVAEQAADYLRAMILRGHWGDTMPGRHELAAEMGINHKTVEAALKHLEQQGLLMKQGMGRGRRIRRPEERKSGCSLRIAILTCTVADRSWDYVVDMRYRLNEGGHLVFHTRSCLHDLGMELRRVAKLVRQTEADAWVVMAASRELLEWFVTQRIAVFALFGQRDGLPLASAGPDKPPAYARATRKLLELGHRRIVLLARRLRRLPMPGTSERAFLAELEAAGITPAAHYHLPDWEETVDGFHQRLDSLFQISPPTALIVDSVPLFSGVEQFLARRGLRVPEDVSLVCTDESPTFNWHRPSVAHIRWDRRPVVLRVVNWAAHISRGKKDIRQVLTPAEFVSGGSIGPVCPG